MFSRDEYSLKPELNCAIEEADARIIPHLKDSVKNGNKEIVVSSTDTDVLVLLIHYFMSLEDHTVKVWNLFGAGDKTRYIPIHSLVQKLGCFKIEVLLTVHTLSGCDVTSKVGTKAAAMKQIDWSPLEFGKTKDANLDILQQAERYLVKLLDSTSKCTTFDELRYHLYINKGKTIAQLPPTSTSLMGHLLRSHYWVYMHRNLYNPPLFENLDPANFGWERENKQLLPGRRYKRIPIEYVAACGCTKRCDGRCKCRRMPADCSEFCSCSNMCTNN